MARRRSRRRLAITALVMAFVAAVVGLAVAGNGEPASALRLLTGGAWLGNTSTGTVSHVDGYTGGTDAQASVGKAGDPFEVVQRAGGAYVLDLRTGRLSRLDDTTLSVATTTAESGPARALQVVAGATTTWVLDRSSGILQQVNPTTLAPVGRQIALGGPTGVATIDGSGSIWVPVAAQAGVEEANQADVVTRHPFGRTGDAVQVADTSGGVWAVDPDSATAASLQEPSLHQVALPPMPSAAPPVVGASTSSADLVVLAGSEVLDIDTSGPALSSLELPAASQSTQVAVVSNRAYLLDGPAGELETVQLAPLKALAPIPVPRGADQLVTQDQLVFVNRPGTPQALVVNSSGSVTTISKYQPAAPASAKHQSAGGRSASSPTLSPSPAGGTPAPSPSGGGSSVTSVTSPPTIPPTSGPPPTSPPPSVVTPPTQPPPTPPTSQPPTVPGAPAVTQVNAGDGVLTVGWAPPASNGGSPIVRYQVTATPSGAHLSAGGTATSATLSGQPDGVRECVQVQAVNAVGGGPLSPAGQSCATPLKDSPGQVTGVQASATGAGQISLAWRQPALGPYHTPIASYTVTGGPASRTVTATQAVVKGLAAGTAYSFTIVATNTKGNTGPASAPVRATTWSPPSAVRDLTVAGGDGQLSISWSAATVPAGSPAITGYQLSVGGSTSSTGKTSATVTVPVWTNETVKVAALNSVGAGPSTTGSGTAWARSGTVRCHDVLSGDTAVENDCTLDAPGDAWQNLGASPINWIKYPVSSGGRPAGTNEYVCTSYFTGGVSGDRYALVSTPSDCPTALAGYQSPVPHAIAYVSTTQINSSSQHVCEYEGTTSGTNGPYTSYELSPCGTIPSGLSGASEKFSFWT